MLSSCFSVTIASCFGIVDKQYIEELKDKSENESTKNCTGYWKNVISKKWAKEGNLPRSQGLSFSLPRKGRRETLGKRLNRKFQVNLEEYESDVLDQWNYLYKVE